jgi:hypothetical protein
MTLYGARLGRNHRNQNWLSVYSSKKEALKALKKHKERTSLWGRTTMTLYELKPILGTRVVSKISKK